MVNFVLIYKPYTISKEREHRWTMYKNMCVFKKVLAAKCSTTTNSTTANMDIPYLKLYPVTISYSAIIYVITTILVAIVTHLLGRYLYRKRPQHGGGWLLNTLMGSVITEAKTGLSDY